MSTVLAEPINLGDVLLYEEENFYYSRDEITIAAPEVIAIGQVLGQIIESGEYAALDFTATDGTENAAAIAVRNINAALSAVETVGITRHAIVKADGLVWPVEMTTQEHELAIAQLKANGILVRR